MTVDWKARAEREAAAIIAGAVGTVPYYRRDEVLTLCSVAWLQGVNYGQHETLRNVEDAFDELQGEL